MSKQFTERFTEYIPGIKKDITFIAEAQLHTYPDKKEGLEVSCVGWEWAFFTGIQNEFIQQYLDSKLDNDYALSKFYKK